MTALNIQKTFTPSYSPEGDRVERAHQVLGNILRADHSTDPTDWTTKLPVAVFCYNSAVNRMIGMSPFQAVYGHPPLLPVDLIFPLKRKEGISWVNYVEVMRRRFQNLMEKVCKTQETSLNLDSRRVQGRSSKPSLAPGDVVFYFLPRVKRGQATKLQSKWIGPFQIRRVVSDSLIVIYPLGTWAIHPREISTIVSRVKKIDPKLSSTELFSTRRHRIDLDNLGGEMSETEDNLGFQDDVEDIESQEKMEGQVQLAIGMPLPPERTMDEQPVDVNDPHDHIPANQPLPVTPTAFAAHDPAGLPREFPLTEEAELPTVVSPKPEPPRSPAQSISRELWEGASSENWEGGDNVETNPPSEGGFRTNEESPSFDPNAYRRFVDRLTTKKKRKQGKDKILQQGEYNEPDHENLDNIGRNLRSAGTMPESNTTPLQGRTPNMLKRIQNRRFPM
jgi:hypothetical protein